MPRRQRTAANGHVPPRQSRRRRMQKAGPLIGPASTANFWGAKLFDKPRAKDLRAMLFVCSDATNGRAAVGALSLGDGLAVLRRALDGILHNLLCLALHAISLDCHGDSTSLFASIGKTTAKFPREPSGFASDVRALYCTKASMARRWNSSYIFLSNSMTNALFCESFSASMFSNTSSLWA